MMTILSVFHGKSNALEILSCPTLIFWAFKLYLGFIVFTSNDSRCVLTGYYSMHNIQRN